MNAGNKAVNAGAPASITGSQAVINLYPPTKAANPSVVWGIPCMNAKRGAFHFKIFVNVNLNANVNKILLEKEKGYEQARGQ